MGALNNVVRHNQQGNTVFKHIQSFLRNKGIRSENTEVSYEGDIRLFFRYMRNKDIEDLTIEDLNFVNADIMDYQTYLKDEHVNTHGTQYSNASINRKMTTIVSLYNFLERNQYNVNPAVMKVDDLPDDTKPIGFLTPEEVETMAELVLNQRSGKEKRALIMLAVRTGLRKDALLTLKWDQITPHTDKQDYYLIRTYDKGTYVVKEIHRKMYEVLQSIKFDDSRVFRLDFKTADKMMKRLCTEMGIGDYRNISFHSIKKASGQYVYDQTGGDMNAVAQQLSHKNIQTSYKHYSAKIMNKAATMDEEKDKQIFDELSHEELVDLVKSFNNGLGEQLMNAAKKMLEVKRK